MSVQRRIAIATRGFRGDIGEKFYVNEAISLDEGTFNVDIIETVPVATIEVISVEVSSIDIEGAM